MRCPACKITPLLGVLVACKPDIPDPIWKGQYLHYSATTSGPVCRGSFYRQEQHVVELARLLGFELPAVIHYTQVARSEVPEYCEGLNADGCAYVDSPYAFSAWSFNFHELTHAVAYLAGIEGPTPFEEGFAEVFNDGGDPDTEPAPLDEVLRGFKYDGTYYYTAGQFVRFLIERYGLEPFVQFLRSTGSDDFEQFAPIFADVFGEPIEAAMSEFDNYPNCPEISNRIALVDCNLPLQPWDGRTVTLTAKVACDQDDVLGPTLKDVMLTTRAFEVEQAGSYLFLASASEGWSGFRVVKCGSCWDSFDAQFEPGEMTVHELTPGRYYALFGRNLDEPAEIGLAVGRL